MKKTSSSGIHKISYYSGYLFVLGKKIWKNLTLSTDNFPCFEISEKYGIKVSSWN